MGKVIADTQSQRRVIHAKQGGNHLLKGLLPKMSEKHVGSFVFYANSIGTSLCINANNVG